MLIDKYVIKLEYLKRKCITSLRNYLILQLHLSSNMKYYRYVA